MKRRRSAIVAVMGIVASVPVFAADPAIAPLSGTRFVQGAVDALDVLKGLGLAAYCRPDAVTVKDVILMFKSEAAIYPQVLDLPAAELIAGMFVKLFPCR